MDEDVIVTLRYAVVMETDAKCAAAAVATARYTRATNRNAQLLCYCRRATRRANKSQLIPSTPFFISIICCLLFGPAIFIIDIGSGRLASRPLFCWIIFYLILFFALVLFYSPT